MKTLTVLFLLFAGMAQAATYYISPTGSGTDGKSFATAWREFSGIRGLQPGDTIYIGQGTYQTAPRIEVDGVVLRKSRLAGYDGPVTINCAAGAQIRVWARNVTIDGVDRDRFTIRVARSDGNPCIYVGYGSYDAAGSVLKNFTIQGVNTSPTAAGVGMNVYSDGVTLENLKFIGNPGEDQLGMFQGGTVRNCDFSGQTDSGTTVHRDVISVYPGPSGSQKLLIEDSYFHDAQTDTIILLTDYETVYSQVEIIGNTFWNLDTCIKWDSRNPVNANTRIAITDNRWGFANIWIAGTSPKIVETGTVKIGNPDATPVPTPPATLTPTPTPRPTATATPAPTPTATPQIIHIPAGEYKIRIEGAVEIER